MMRWFLLLVVGPGPGDGAELRYNRDVRPILSDKRFACHGPDAHDAKAGLQLHAVEPATNVVRGLLA